MTYTWIDFLIIAIFVLSMLIGLRRGFILEAVSLGTLIAAFVVAIMFSNSLANWLSHSAAAQSVVASLASVFGEAGVENTLSLITLGLSFFILFLLTMLVGEIIGRMVSGASNIPGLGFIDRVLGVVFGAIRGFLFSVVVLFLLSLTSVAQSQAWTGSQYVPQFQSSIIWVSNVVKPGLQVVTDKMTRALEDMNNKNNNSSSGVYNGTAN